MRTAHLPLGVLLWLATACAGPTSVAQDDERGAAAAQTSVLDPSAPRLLDDVRPDVRVLSLALRPTADGYRVTGRFVLPRPVLPADGQVLLEGLDAHGRSLVTLTSRMAFRDPAAGRHRRRHAAFSAVLPALEALTTVRVRLPAAR